MISLSVLRIMINSPIIGAEEGNPGAPAMRYARCALDPRLRA
ncbi:hypothetical protein COXBURSA331_A0688 [Coxiella burnetii RSA 331]|nr:hypothetical protein COXBURSA331_A0688 [Coxiella burnetii RSA 331]EDR35810.1 hypothetical protein COXBURSA334_1457 [Coxiella burnetii Q321]